MWRPRSWDVRSRAIYRGCAGLRDKSLDYEMPGYLVNSHMIFHVNAVQ
jgi:hypothetical protein